MRGKHEEWDDELLARAVGLKRAGFSNKQIAEKLGKPLGSVKVRMARVGAKRRLDGKSGSRIAPPIGRMALDTITSGDATTELLGTSSTTED
jgi:hypothetical protein